MTKPTKKISRRDAIKLLGAAAGATVLANLPTKWNTPEMASGVLPAHAQTSNILHTLACQPNQQVPEPDSDPYISGVIISPIANPGIVMRWSIVLINVTLDNPADPLTGTALTETAGGLAVVLTPPVTIVNPGLDASVTVNWSFENASDGTGSCDQVFQYTPIIIG